LDLLEANRDDRLGEVESSLPPKIGSSGELARSGTSRGMLTEVARDFLSDEDEELSFKGALATAESSTTFNDTPVGSENRLVDSLKDDPA
jgi:hypothetical protein